MKPMLENTARSCRRLAGPVLAWGAAGGSMALIALVALA